jgi:uncharacterized protein YoxC
MGLKEGPMKSTRQLLEILGWVGVIAGLFILAYSWLVLRPLLSNVTQQVQGDLTDVRTASESLRGNKAAAQIINLLPNTFATLHGTLLSASTAMYSTAKTTNDVKKGVTGLLMPKTALSQDTNRLSKTGEQLKLLADVIGDMEPSVTQLSGSLKQFTQQAETISSRAEDLRSSLSHAALPAQAALLGSAISLIFLFLGSFCLIVSRAVAGLSLSSGTENQSLFEREKFLPQSKSA